MYRNYSIFQRFHNLIFQAVLRFQRMIFPDVLRFQDSSKMIQDDPKRIQYLSKLFQIYGDLLKFQGHLNLFKISKMSLRFHHVGFPFVKPIGNAYCFKPTEFDFSFVDPHQFSPLNNFKFPNFNVYK